MCHRRSQNRIPIKDTKPMQQYTNIPFVLADITLSLLKLLPNSNINH